jgi:iron complex transport system substrate-binding protein
VTARLRLLLACALATIGLSTAACGERSEPTGSSADLYPLTVTTAGERPLTVRSPVRRIAVLASGPEQILLSLGARKRVVGRPVGDGGVIELKRLVSSKPDLIVASPAFDDVVLSRAAAMTHAPVYIAPGDSIRDVERAITQLGLITESQVAARALVRSIEQARRKVTARIRQDPPVSVFVDVGFSTTVSNQSLIGDLIREAGGLNAAGDDHSNRVVDLKELAALDPEIYLATSDSQTTLASLRKLPHARSVRAIRQRRFAVIDASLLQPGPRIGEGLLALARILHPDAFR